MSSLPAPGDPDDADTAPDRALLLVSTGGRIFALPLDLVHEVVTARPATPLPGAPSWVVGLVNLRGRIVTVIDLSARLRLRPAAGSAAHRVVVVRHGERRVGLAVEDVVRIVRTDTRSLEPLAQPDASPGSADFLTHEGRSGSDVFVTVDTDALLQPIFT